MYTKFVCFELCNFLKERLPGASLYPCVNGLTIIPHPLRVCEDARKRAGMRPRMLKINGRDSVNYRDQLYKLR